MRGALGLLHLRGKGRKGPLRDKKCSRAASLETADAQSACAMSEKFAIEIYSQ
jgi:hypothetical protein